MTLTSNDILVILFMFLIRELFPWLMKSFFPAKLQQSQLQIESELALKKEIADREFAFKKEIAGRELELKEEINKTLDTIQRHVESSNNLLSAINAQQASQGQMLTNIQIQNQSYFSEGREAIKQIHVLAASNKKSVKNK